MATTAEVYGFGARAPYAEPRASDYEMKERVRLSGLFPRVRNEPMSKQLQGLLKEFEQNAALTGILERRRRLEERLQYELRGTEGMDALRQNLAPPFRAGLAGAAVSADVADRLARSQQPGALAPAALLPNDVAAAKATAAAAKAAAAKVRIRKPPATGGAGVSSEGGSVSSGIVRTSQDDLVLSGDFIVEATGKAKAPPPKAAPKTRSRSRPKAT